ncbi:MAG: hypothetical protein R3D58_22350 [Saprospiraceae bacterium]
MKTNFFASKSRNSILGLLLILLVFLLYKYCCPFSDQGPIQVKGPIKAPLGVSFIDVNGANTNVQNVKVTLIDPGKKVVSSNAVPFQTVDVEGGVMSIGLASDAVFSVDSPYLFYIRAEADGYMTNIRPVVITADVPEYLPIYMSALRNLPPSGLASLVGNISTIQGGVLQTNETLISQSPQNTMRPMTIRMEEGLRFLCNGKPVTTPGALNYRLLFGMPRDSNANRVFPGGFEVLGAVDQSGKQLANPRNPAFFTTGGWFSLEMNIGKEGINGFSKPVLVDMPIADSTINPETQAMVKVGDTFPLWSLNNSTGVWTQEDETVVTENPEGGLKISFPITHLSTFNADWFTGACSTGTQRIDVSYTFDAANSTGFGGNRFTRLVNTADGSEIRAKTINFDNTGNLEVIRTPAGFTTQLLVHQGANSFFPIQGTSGSLSCPGTGSLALVGSAPATCILLEFVTGAANAPVNNQCYNSVWTKNSCADPMSMFLFEGIINGDGNLIMPNYPANRCVRLWFLDDSPGSDQIYLEFTINFGIATIPPGSPTSGTITTNAAGGPYSFTYWRENTAVGDCTTRIRINIPAGLVSGNACPP